MEDNTLFMLCDPKKCKPNTQNTMDVFINNYTQHNNILNSNNEDNIENNNDEINEQSKNSDDEIEVLLENIEEPNMDNRLGELDAIDIDHFGPEYYDGDFYGESNMEDEFEET